MRGSRWEERSLSEEILRPVPRPDSTGARNYLRRERENPLFFCRHLWSPDPQKSVPSGVLV